jgi:hypothetical protein
VGIGFEVFSCSCGGPQGLGWGFRCGCCFGFLRVCAFLLYTQCVRRGASRLFLNKI